MANLVQRIRSGRSLERQNPWPTVTFDQLPMWLGQFGYQGLGYGPALIQTYQANRESISADFMGFVKGAYKSNGPIFALMAFRLLMFSEARFQFRRMNNGRPGQLFGTPALEPLEHPWQNGTTGDLLARAISDVDIAGNFYATRVAGPAPGQVRIVRLRPDWVTIVLGSMEDTTVATYDPTAELIGYIYNRGGPGSGLIPHLYLPDEVMHFAPFVDPTAHYRGISWLEPVLQEVLGDRAMNAHKLQFFNNGASPNLVVSMETGKMDRTTFLEWIKMFEAEHEGVANAYKCAARDCEVALWNGARCRADEIQVGDVVVAWAADGKPAPGLITRNDVQPAAPIVTVKTARGRTIRVCDRHPFLLQGGASRGAKRLRSGWVLAKDLKPGDRLVTGLGWGRPRRQDTIAPDMAWLLGFLVGDGSFIATTPTATIANENVRARAATIADLRKIEPRPNALYDYRLRGIRKEAVAAGLNGKRAWEKRVPVEVMTGGLEVVGAFLSGLIDADGHVADPQVRYSAEVGITSTSYELLRDVQHLLASVGVNASLSSPQSMAADTMPVTHRVQRRHQAHRLVALGADQAKILNELLDLAHEEKAARLAEYAGRSSGRDGSRVDRVESVTVGPPEPVIGLEVAEHHTHVTGGVVTKNTLYLGQGAQATVVGSDLKQMDFKVVQGSGETRLAAAAGIPPVLVGFSEGLASATYSNYAMARRRVADMTFRPLWRNFCGSLETLITVPSGAQLWYDDRDIPFLQEDVKDEAEIALTRATALKMLTDAGYTGDSAVQAIESNDFSLLDHSGLYSVQLLPPGTNGNANGNGNGSGPPHGGGHTNPNPGQQPSTATNGTTPNTPSIGGGGSGSEGSGSGMSSSRLPPGIERARLSGNAEDLARAILAARARGEISPDG